MAPNHRESRETKRKGCSFMATFTFVRRNSIVLMKIQRIGKKPVVPRNIFQYTVTYSGIVQKYLDGWCDSIERSIFLLHLHVLYTCVVQVLHLFVIT